MFSINHMQAHTQRIQCCLHFEDCINADIVLNSLLKKMWCQLY